MLRTCKPRPDSTRRYHGSTDEEAAAVTADRESLLCSLLAMLCPPLVGWLMLFL